MSRKFLLIPVEHEKRCEWVTRPETDTLAWMQAQVGGYIEQVALERDDRDPDEDERAVGASLWVNEEGLLERLPLNPRASDVVLWYFGFGAQPLVGPVLLEIWGAPSAKLKQWLDDVVSMVPA